MKRLDENCSDSRKISAKHIGENLVAYNGDFLFGKSHKLYRLVYAERQRFAAK